MGQRESVGGGQLLVPEVRPACPGSRLFPAVAGGAVPPARGSRPVGWAASRPGSDVPPLPRRMTRVDLRSYLQRIYNVPVAAVRTRVQHGGCPGLAAAPLPAWAPRPPSCSGARFSAWEARGVEAAPGVMPVTVTGPSWVWDGAGPGAGSTGCSEQPQAAAGQPGISFVLNPFPFLPGDPGSLRGGSEGLRATAGSPTTALHSRKWLCVLRRGRAFAEPTPRPALAPHAV